MNDGPAAVPATRRQRGAPSVNATPTPEVSLTDQARQLIADLDALQEQAYVTLRADLAEVARDMDTTWPLWSLTHIYKGEEATRPVGWAAETAAGQAALAGWKAYWANIASLYIYHSLTHEDIARFSGVALRTIAGHSGKYGWVQARRTYRLMRESEETPDLKTLKEEVRKEKISEFLTQSGFELGRHAMQSLLQNVDKIEPRDIAPLLTAATKLLSMGTGMPETFRHSKVENPLAAQAQQITTNNFALMSPEKMVEFLETLQARKAVLEQAALEASNPKR